MPTFTDDAGVVRFEGELAGFALASATTRLDNATVKALPSVAAEVVPAPAADELLVLLGAVVGPLDGAAYTNASSVAAHFAYGPDDIEQLTQTAVLDNIVAGATGNLMGFGSNEAFSGHVERTPVCIGASIILVVVNGAGGNFTGGAAGNELPISVIYATVAVG